MRQIGRKTHVPRKIDIGASSVRELISIHIVALLIVAAGMAIIQRAIKRQFKPVISESTAQAFAKRQVLSDILISICQLIQIFTVADIACAMTEATAGKRIDGKTLVAQCQHRAKHTSRTPVAIDILGLSYVSTGLLVINTLAADAVQCILEEHMRHHTTLSVYIECIEEC